MRSVLALASVATFAGLAAAQTATATGYGRFPCTLVNGDGSFSPNQALCADDVLIAPGADSTDAGVGQGDRVSPTNSQCVQELESGAYFCGIAGATCTTAANCDNGPCTNGVCQGGFSQQCAGDDTLCSGFLYCLASDLTVVGNTCGGVGAFCQDAVSVDPSFTAAQAQPIFNQFCTTGYCNGGTGNCDNYVALGGDCSIDPDFGCGPNAYCDQTNPLANVCRANAVASGRARARRNELHRRNLCPASHSACAVQGGSGFECIDTTSNLEQCGACASQGGVDCTQIPGVSSVGCVAGVCEIWSCESGFEWNASTNACESA
ncbi:hypothetical protein JCM8097_007181 [Rhodosporidiobolus ruineniae]